MNKILVFNLLLSIACSHLGYYFIYTYNQYKLKETIKHKIALSLPESKLIRIQESKYINWEEENKEFSIDEKMYDVFKIKIENNKRTYYCLNDEEESNLLKDYFQKISQEKRNSKQKNNKTNAPFQFVSIVDDDVISFISTKNNVVNNYIEFSQKVISKSISKPQQPPEFFFI